MSRINPDGSTNFQQVEADYDRIYALIRAYVPGGSAVTMSTLRDIIQDRSEEDSRIILELFYSLWDCVYLQQRQANQERVNDICINPILPLVDDNDYYE